MKKILFICSMILMTGTAFAQMVSDTLSIPVAASPKIKPVEEKAASTVKVTIDAGELERVAIKGGLLAVHNKLVIAPLYKVFKPEELENKVIVLVFWSAECTSCTNDFADLSRIFKKYHGNKELMVIAVTKDNNRIASDKLKQQPLLYTEFVNNATGLVNAYQIVQEPTYVIADKSRNITYAVSGKSDVVLPAFKRALDATLVK